MKSHSFAFVSLAAFALAGCGETPVDQLPPGKSQLTFETGDFEVGPGDVFECFYTDQYTEAELAVTGGTGQQGKGGHHVVVYWTDVFRDPQHHACIDEEMTTWHQIAGSGGDGGDTVSLPDGAAIKVPEGKQLVIQAHYINTTGETMTVNDTASIDYVDPSQVQSFVNYYVLNDDHFAVEPNSSLKSVSHCTVDRDLDIVLLLGHMHELGANYKLEIVDENDQPLEVLYDEPWEPSYASHPPIERWTLDAPLSLPKGTRLRQTCDWNNSTAEPAAFPREMCVAFSYYLNDVGELSCEMDFSSP